MKRIKKLIAAFFDLGRSPSNDLAEAWGYVCASIPADAAAKAKHSINLIDRAIKAIVSDAEDIERKAKSGEEAE